MYTTQHRIAQMYGDDVAAWLLSYGYLSPDGEWTLDVYRDRIEAIECAQECLAIQRMTHGSDHVADSAAEILRAHHALMKALETINPKPGPLIFTPAGNIIPDVPRPSNIINLNDYRKTHGKTSTSSKS